MKNTWNNLDRIEAWKFNELDQQAKEQFEKKMNQDSTLANDLKTYNNIIEHIERFGNQRIRNTILNVEGKLESQGFFNENQSIVRPFIKKTERSKDWAIAASIAAILVVSVFILWPSDNYPLPNVADLKLENRHLVATIEDLSVPGLGDKEKGKKDSLAFALLLVKQDEYVKARMALLQYLNSYPDDNTAQLYLGISYVHEGKYAKGAKYLTPLTRIAEKEDRDLAKWYAAMCYTQFQTEHDLDTARFLLQELASDSGSKYYENAKAYLDLLKK
ncbi:MAG: hypothetical protein HOP11_04095 [Saprospiraceae bacterium]|nr:hypothetical protein [Saprospiraceae bacterium]